MMFLYVCVGGGGIQLDDGLPLVAMLSCYSPWVVLPPEYEPQIPRPIS